MSLRVRVLRWALSDVDEILTWLRQRSPSGARAWYQALLRALDDVRRNPVGFGFAPENSHFKRDVRQAIFKTRAGNRYRAVFILAIDEVRVLRVRGSGQQLLSDRDVRFEDPGELVDPVDDLH